MGIKQISLTVLFVCLGTFAKANSGEAPAEKKIAPPTSEQELQEAQAQVQSINGRIANRKKEIQKLQEEQEHEKDQTKLEEILTKLKTEAKELQKDTKEYNEALYRLKYQFPERGSTKLSEEKLKEIKTLRDLQDQHSIEGKIKKSMKVIREHIKKKDTEVKKETNDSEASKKEVPVDPLLQPVIIRK